VPQASLTFLLPSFKHIHDVAHFPPAALFLGVGAVNRCSRVSSCLTSAARCGGTGSARASYWLLSALRNLTQRIADFLLNLSFLHNIERASH
jgi:hypothetical protein